MTTSTLPHGDVGRIVNSFVGVSHPDAIEWQRDFRNNLYANSAKNKNMELLLESIKGQVYLACLKEIDQKYIQLTVYMVQEMDRCLTGFIQRVLKKNDVAVQLLHLTLALSNVANTSVTVTSIHENMLVVYNY